MSRCHGATVGARARANLIDRAADSSTTKLGRSRCLANSNGVQSLSPGLPRTLSGLPWVTRPQISRTLKGCHSRVACSTAGLR